MSVLHQTYCPFVLHQPWWSHRSRLGTPLSCSTCRDTLLTCHEHGDPKNSSLCTVCQECPPDVATELCHKHLQKPGRSNVIGKPRKYNCQQCPPSVATQLCHAHPDKNGHKSQKTKCAQCLEDGRGGTSLWPHEETSAKYTYNCRLCSPHLLCKEHGVFLNSCSNCPAEDGSGMCPKHPGVRRQRCTKCSDSVSICGHGRSHWNCNEGCGGASICEHGRRRGECPVEGCGGQALCGMCCKRQRRSRYKHPIQLPDVNNGNITEDVVAELCGHFEAMRIEADAPRPRGVKRTDKGIAKAAGGAGSHEADGDKAGEGTQQEVGAGAAPGRKVIRGTICGTCYWQEVMRMLGGSPKKLLEVGDKMKKNRKAMETTFKGIFFKQFAKGIWKFNVTVPRSDADGNTRKDTRFYADFVWEVSDTLVLVVKFDEHQHRGYWAGDLSRAIEVAQHYASSGDKAREGVPRRVIFLRVNPNTYVFEGRRVGGMFRRCALTNGGWELTEAANKMIAAVADMALQLAGSGAEIVSRLYSGPSGEGKYSLGYVFVNYDEDSPAVQHAVDVLNEDDVKTFHM